jgi:tRNA(Ile)-lysidine synthase
VLIDFLENINKKKVFDQQSRLLLAHSGGKDSMALSHLLLQGGYHFSVAHCNFGLRGAESDQDQDFVQDFCKKNNIPCFTKSFETKKHAKLLGISTQMAARELRYQWFNQLMHDHHLDYLLTAHHLNDRFESLIFNITKGTGPKGLNPISLKSGKLVRPLANFSSNQISQYLHENNIKWREDSSNLTDDYHRNNIRHNVIPVFENINEGLWETQKRNFERFESLNEIFNEKLAAFSQLFVEKEGTQMLSDFESHKYLKGFGLLLEEYLKPFGFNYYQVHNILESNPSGKVFFSTNYQCILDRNTLWIRAKPNSGSDKNIYLIDNEGIYAFENNSLEIKRIDISNNKPDFKNSEKGYFSEEKLTFPLSLRLWREGDSFVPFGMKGSKSISDFLTDIKIPSHIKKEQWVLTSQDQIAWLIGHRTGEFFKVSNEETQCFEIIFNK